MFGGMSGTYQNMIRMIYFEAEDIFWKKWFLIFGGRAWPKRDEPPPRGGVSVTVLRSRTLGGVVTETVLRSRTLVGFTVEMTEN